MIGVTRKPYYSLISDPDSLVSEFGSHGNHIFLSQLREAYSANTCKSFTIKMAAEGVLHYSIDHNYFRVQGDHFLSASRQLHATGYIDSTQLTKSICIYISEATLAEAFTILSAGNKVEFDNHLDHYFQYPHFVDHLNYLDNSDLSLMLRRLRRNFSELKFEYFDEITEEWFYELAEKVIFFESRMCQALEGLDCVKYSTRKETFKRLYKGKKFIDEKFLSNPAIAEAAQFCGMSEFHFYRTFKQAFQMTPYKYMTKKRLEYSARLIRTTSSPLAVIAASCGFIDAFTFSKAFKRHYGYAPSLTR